MPITRKFTRINTTKMCSGAIEINRYFPLISVPDFRTALRFSVEFYPERAIQTYNQGQLPFGCHAWNIHGTDYWRPIFATYGYTI